MRYSLENNYWIKDNETNKHLSLTDAVKVLNEQDARLTGVNTIIDNYTQIINTADVPPGNISVLYAALKLMNNTIRKIKKVVDNE